MDKSETASLCTDNYSIVYDIDSEDEKWDSKNQTPQTYSRDETLTDAGDDNDYQTDLIKEQMKNLCLKNNFVEDTNKKEEKNKQNQRARKIAPHFISNITFDNYGNQDIYEKSKYRRRRKLPYLETTFKIAYDKEELEEDYKKGKKLISPTFESHIFDKDEIVIKQRPINKNSIFYDNIRFDEYESQKVEYKPPLVLKDKFKSNIFNENIPPEVYRRQRSPNARYQMNTSNITFDDYSVSNNEVIRPSRKLYKIDDHINRLYDEPSVQNLNVGLRTYDAANDHINRLYDEPSVQNLNVGLKTFNMNDDHIRRIFADPSIPNLSNQQPTPYQMEDHVNRIFAEPSIHNLAQPFVIPKNSINYSTFNFNDTTKEVPRLPVRNINSLTSSNIYSIFNDGPQLDQIKGIKTYKVKDNIRDLFNSTDDTQNDDVRDLNTIISNNHQSSTQRS